MKKLIYFFIFTIALNLSALTLDGITFDDKISVSGKDLVLNGVGIRKATFLKIKVYYGALYLASKTNDAKNFLTSSDSKQITMQFVRDVDAKDLKKTYKEAFEGSNPSTFKSMLPTFEIFNNHFIDIKKGERLVFTLLSDGVVLTLNGKVLPKVGDGAFSRAILNMWFINPLDENLTKGLLGL